MDPRALHKIGYGVYVVCSKKGENINGQTVNAVMQVTSEPPTVAVSINKQNLTHAYIQESRVFSLSILEQDTPVSFIGTFGFKSGRDVDKFENVTYRTDNATGVPVVVDYATAYIVGKVVQEVDVGTHTIFIGEVIDAGILKECECMTYTYYHQVKRGTTPKAAATYIKEEKAAPAEVKSAGATYECQVCGYIYDPAKGDPDSGIAPGTAFEDLPDTWVCPVCGATKDQFKKLG